MKKLNGKLHSQSGASILLALLFLLVCMMTAASILMAAVSNAGKIRSNYEEQQRYLALSSALRLAVDELEQARYQGRYTVTEWNETITEPGDDNLPVEVSNIDYYHITQEPGTFTCGDLAEAGIPEENAVLTFRKELDRVFSGQFGDSGFQGLEDGDTAPLPTNPPDGQPGAPAPSTRTLTVEVKNGGEVLDQFGSVTLKIDMSQSRRIHLTAILPAENMANGQPDMNGILYTMEAELASALLRTNPDGSTEETAGGVPSIHYSPGTRLPKSEPPLSGSLPGLVVSTPRSHSEATRDVIAWKLDWISKGGTME